MSGVCRYNDLCGRAIILGEEGSLSEESYNIALCSIKEALKQCAILNNSADNVVGSTTIFSIEEENQCSTTSKDVVSDLHLTGLLGELKLEKGKKIVKVPQSGIVSVRSQDSFHLMEMYDLGPTQSHNIVPPQLQNMVPTVFHSMTSLEFPE
ncbi:hypothetical protein RCOM_0962970 [Ricinus communis]|uniref:Uncharacterized protein n=1 Tax=Ricinus communis TaxID=3988 RepID=B9RVJ0_RICCO|nr:hypothetical protein RCOM_0962970 [Ricinus communis]